MRTAAIILAAGASRRLGRPKQLAVIASDLLLERAVRTCIAAELSPVYVVLGANAPQIESACDLSKVKVIRNENWEIGTASSIRAGVNALIGENIDAVVLTTCDMPFVSPAHLRALVALAEEKQIDIGSRGEGWTGVPACFLRESFDDLLALQGDVGARKLLRDAPLVELANGLDVDTPEDLARANEIAVQEC